MALNHFPHIYRPIDVGTMHMKNRIQFSPIVTNHAEFESGRVTHALLDFVSTQAQTGCGLVTIGSTPVDFEHGRDFYGCLGVTNDNDRSGLHLLTDEVHKYGCNLSAELIHAGQWSALNGIQAWVPSIVDLHPQEFKDKDLYKEIGREEMDVVIDHFMKATQRCIDSGFDMVMCHIAHGNLLSAFLSTYWNQRTDAYGGSPQKRWRFPLEVLEAMHSVTKGKIPIEVRVVGDERIPGGTPIEERIEFLKEASKYIDMLCVSTGTLQYGNAMCYNMPSYYVPNGCNVDVAAAFKEALGDKVAVSVVGGINSLELAEKILAEGKADIIAMAKALLADDRMIVKGERGQEDDITPCMRCMYCLRNVGTDMPIHGCAVNPRLGVEYRYPRFIPARKHKKIMVIGGGPAGMFATRTLAERGHEVHLYEKTDRLGGRLQEASALWMKEGFKRYLEFSRRKTFECGAQIHLNTAVTPDLVRAEKPDTVIIALGANEFVPPVKGVDGPNVVSVVDVDRKNVKPGKKVVICGAGMSGAECAMELGREGHECTIVDMMPEDKLYSKLKDFQLPAFIQHLEDNGVERIYEAAVQEINEDGVVIKKNGRKRTLKCDTVITAFGLRADRKLIEELKDIVPETYVVGDADKSGLIGDATNSAYFACLEIDA